MVDPIAIWDRERDVLIWDTDLVGGSFDPAEEIPDAAKADQSPRTKKIESFVSAMASLFGSSVMLDHVIEIGDSADNRMQLIRWCGGYFLKVRLPVNDASVVFREVIKLANHLGLWVRYSKPHTWFIPDGRVFPSENKDKWDFLWSKGWSLFLPEKVKDLKSLLAPYIESAMSSLGFSPGKRPYPEYMVVEEIAKRSGYVREVNHGIQFVFFDYSVSVAKIKILMETTFFLDQYVTLMGDSGFSGGRDICSLPVRSFMGEKSRGEDFVVNSVLDLVDFVYFLGEVFVSVMSKIVSIGDLNDMFFGALSKVVVPFYYYPGALYVAKVAKNQNYSNIVHDALEKEHKWRGPEYFDREVALPKMLELLNNM